MCRSGLQVAGLLIAKPMEAVKLCRLDEIEDGHSRGFDPLERGRDTVFVVRQGETVYAYRNACPHVDDAPMAWRKDAYLDSERQHIRCSGHGALFEIENGLCIEGPCLGKSLKVLPVKVSQGDIYVLADFG